MLFSGAAVGNWVVETTIEYADRRDNTAQKEFLNTVYAAAIKQIAGPQPTVPVVAPPALVPKPAVIVPAAIPNPQAEPPKPKPGHRPPTWPTRHPR